MGFSKLNYQCQFKIFLILFLLASNNACVSAPNNEYNNFYRQDLSARKQQISDFPLKKQLEIYIYGMNHIHPQPLDMISPLAQNGVNILPILIERLSKEKKEYIIVALTDVLVEINKCCFKISKRNDIMTELNTILNNMKIETWKSMVKENILLLRNE